MRGLLDDLADILQVNFSELVVSIGESQQDLLVLSFRDVPLFLSKLNEFSVVFLRVKAGLTDDELDKIEVNIDGPVVQSALQLLNQILSDLLVLAEVVEVFINGILQDASDIHSFKIVNLAHHYVQHFSEDAFRSRRFIMTVVDQVSANGFRIDLLDGLNDLLL